MNHKKIRNRGASSTLFALLLTGCSFFPRPHMWGYEPAAVELPFQMRQEFQSFDARANGVEWAACLDAITTDWGTYRVTDAHLLPFDMNSDRHAVVQCNSSDGYAHSHPNGDCRRSGQDRVALYVQSMKFQIVWCSGGKWSYYTRNGGQREAK